MLEGRGISVWAHIRKAAYSSQEGRCWEQEESFTGQINVDGRANSPFTGQGPSCPWAAAKQGTLRYEVLLCCP